MGDPIVKAAESPVAEGGEVLGKVVSAVLNPEGGGIRRRAASMAKMMSSLVRVRGSKREGRKDPVALDNHLRRDFEENARGVQVVDDPVQNDYQVLKNGEMDSNPHKSYGYLRTPELSRHVAEFLAS